MRCLVEIHIPVWTGDRKQECRLARVFWVYVNCSGCARAAIGSLAILKMPWRQRGIAREIVPPLQHFQGFRVSFYRGNVSYVWAETLRARLFLFPVPCSLLPLHCPLRSRHPLGKSEFTPPPHTPESGSQTTRCRRDRRSPGGSRRRRPYRQRCGDWTWRSRTALCRGRCCG